MRAVAARPEPTGWPALRALRQKVFATGAAANFAPWGPA
jgi:hypothetical protein